MRHLPAVAGAVLGLMFIGLSSMFLLGMVPNPELPTDTPVYHFFLAFGPTGYMTFVKLMELLGGILVAVPKTRNIGLLILVPILVNILAFHIFVTAGEGLFNPIICVIFVLTAYLVWAGRRAGLGLLN